MKTINISNAFLLSEPDRSITGNLHTETGHRLGFTYVFDTGQLVLLPGRSKISDSELAEIRSFILSVFPAAGALPDLVSIA